MAMNFSALNWNDVHFFTCLVQANTLTAAAERLQVQHSTVSRRIEHLEQQLGVRLFDRVGKRYQLTSEGLLLYPQACEAARAMQVLQRMAIDQNAMQGEVVVSAPPILANELIMAWLPRFMQRYPAIKLVFKGESQFADLHQRQADIAVRLSRPERNDLAIKRLAEVDYRCYADAEYLRKRPAERWQFIDVLANQQLLPWYQRQINGRETRLTSNDFYSVQRLIRQAVGIGMLPCFLGDADEQLVAVDCLTGALGDIAEPLTLSLYIVMHEDIRRSPRVRAVADFLIAQFESLETGL